MDRLEARFARLERANRRLLALWGLTVAALVLLGAQSVSDVIRARRIELVDARGVPLATLAPARGDLGGELILRDRDGERRASLAAEPGAATLDLQGGRPDDPSGTAALRADTEGAAMGLVGSKASVSASVRKERPHLAMTDARGRQAFEAPFRSTGR